MLFASLFHHLRLRYCHFTKFMIMPHYIARVYEMSENSAMSKYDEYVNTREIYVYDSGSAIHANAFQYILGTE